MAHDSGIPSAVPFRTLGELSGAWKAAPAVLVLAGVAAVIIAVVGYEPARLWQGLLFNWLFWSSLAIGMVMFAVALHLTAADWAWSIQRFALAGVAFLPISLILLIVVFFGSETYFHHWLHPEGFDPVIEGKRAWLTLPSMIGRDFFALIVLYGLAIAFAYFSLRPDVYGIVGPKRNGIYERLTGGWRGVEAEAARSQKVRNHMGPVMGILYAVVWGLIGIDLAMTLDPHFFSTMFPVTFFWAAFHGGVAATAVAVVLLRPRLELEKFVTKRQFHDLGKLVFAFSVFWMYINWSQYIVIWYGLLPWEQPFFIDRFDPPFGIISAAVVLLIFVIPFLGLLSRPPKMVPAILAFFAGLILIGNWLERFLITVPSIWEEDYLPLGIPEIGIGLGFLGLFAATYLWFVRTFPMLPSPASLAAREPALVAVPVGD
ncbi:MAG: hypothetical protein GEU90_05050 [Gemmatimonas sp.]|nr:hypothetical protein [Gemmatimonas sp.]